MASKPNGKKTKARQRGRKGRKGMCGEDDISGGRVLWKGMRLVKNRAGQMLRMAASSLHHSQTPMGNYLRQMKARRGPAAAITATAHKIALIFYTMVKNRNCDGRLHNGATN